MQWKSRRNRPIAAGVALGVGLIAAVTGCGSSHKAATPTTTSKAAPTTSTAAPTTPSSTAPATTASTAPASPAALLAAALADAKARQSMHIAVSDHSPNGSQQLSDDAAVGRGEQNITAGGITAKVIWVNNVAYIMGNAQAITSYFGFPAAAGPQLAGHWVSIPPSDPDYATVTDAVGIGSALQEFGVKGPFTLLPKTTKDGQMVVGVRGTASSPDMGSAGTPATLYVTDGPTPLPVEFDSSSSQGTSQAVFTAWGEPVTLTAPSAPIPVSSVPTSTTTPSAG